MTVTPGNTIPDVDDTLPLTVIICAKALVENKPKIKSKNDKRRKLLKNICSFMKVKI
jgi:hypothetical protein